MNTQADLSAMTNKELVAIHNGLAEQCEDVKPLTAWKKSKDLLIEKIEQLREEVRANEPEPEVEDDDEPKRTIKAASVELLCHVAHYEDRDAKPGTTEVAADDPKARSVGLAYDEIIRRVQDEFPGCSTSVACLRWYAVKIRVGEHGYEDLRLPQRRPRAKPKTAK